MKKLEEFPAGKARESQYAKASKSLDEYRPKISKLMGNIAMIYLESRAKGMDHEAMIKLLMEEARIRKLT